MTTRARTDGNPTRIKRVSGAKAQKKVKAVTQPEKVWYSTPKELRRTTPVNVMLTELEHQQLQELCDRYKLGKSRIVAAALAALECMRPDNAKRHVLDAAMRVPLGRRPKDEQAVRR